MIQFLITVVIILLAPPTTCTKTLQARMTVNETYKPGYSNSKSAEFKTFATNFSRSVGEFLSKKLVGFKSLEVKKLTSGSVVVSSAIVLNESVVNAASLDLLHQAIEQTTRVAGLGYTFLGNVSVNATDSSESVIDSKDMLEGVV